VSLFSWGQHRGNSVKPSFSQSFLYQHQQKRQG
jgi:hypothetical protein